MRISKITISFIVQFQCALVPIVSFLRKSVVIVVTVIVPYRNDDVILYNTQGIIIE